MEPGGQRRRRDAAASRRAIESAARDLFATRGYALTGVRDIAARADVNSALVGRYFGAKGALFRTIVDTALDLQPMLDSPRDTFGKHAVALLRSSQTAFSPLVMMLLSMGDPEASAISARQMQDAVITPLAIWLGGPSGAIRARRLALLWSGYLAQMRLLPDAPSADIAGVEDWVARVTQDIVDEDAEQGRCVGHGTPRSRSS